MSTVWKVLDQAVTHTSTSCSQPGDKSEYVYEDNEMFVVLVKLRLSKKETREKWTHV